MNAKIYQELVDFHLYCLLFFFIMLCLYLYFVRSKSQAFSYIKRIRLLLPLYYMSLACVGLSGFNLLALRSFSLNPALFFMLFSWLLMLVASIKIFKLFKKARAIKDFSYFKHFASLSLIAFILLVLLQSYTYFIG